jgi:outer membrane immunogenic protein
LVGVWGVIMRRFHLAVLTAVASIGFASIASAADMQVKAPAYKAPIAAPIYSWTGFYFGANIGDGWGSRDVNLTANDSAIALFFAPALGGPPPPISFNSSGLIGGMQLGYNWQFNRNWLVGFEADFNWSGIKGSGSSSYVVAGTSPVSESNDERIKWFGTVRTRAGYIPIDNLLLFITGGFAYGKVEHSGTYTNNGTGFTTTIPPFTASCAGNAVCASGSSSDTATGWTVGGGLEYALWQHFTLKAEYLYVSLDSKSFTETLLFKSAFTSSSINAGYSRTNFNVARVGLNYRF